MVYIGNNVSNRKFRYDFTLLTFKGRAIMWYEVIKPHIKIAKGNSMKQYIELGSVPMSEECLQVGSASLSDMRAECGIYQHQLGRLFPHCEFGVKTFPHDFGSYPEVVVYFHDGQLSEESAYDVEGRLPEHWDSIALEKLKERGWNK